MMSLIGVVALMVMIMVMALIMMVWFLELACFLGCENVFLSGLAFGM